MQRLTTLLLIYLLLSGLKLNAQTQASADSLQNVLSKLSQDIWKQKTDSLKIKSSNEFASVFHSILINIKNWNFLFDSIPGITECHSESRSLQLFTWNIPLSNGKFVYKGFIRLPDTTNPIIELSSEKFSLSIANLQQIALPDWYGALYYKLIEQKHDDEIIFTLLGWDGADNTMNRKIIDIISISEQSKVVFGKPIFKTDKGIRQRIILEYAEKANCTLRYDYQTLNILKGKRIVKKQKWMIVFDRLVPMDPTMKGITKYYVASGDTYDGFIFKDGFWVLVEDVDVKNQLTEKPKLK